MTKAASSVSHVVIYTDGACSGNPGPGGWGVSLRHGDRYLEMKGGEADTTNNRMELTAAIRGLKKVTSGTPIKLHTDSKYVMDGIGKWIHGWKKNGWKTSTKKPVKNEDLWRELDELNSARTVEWVWVKGHAGNPGNERADALAAIGMGKYR